MTAPCHVCDRSFAVSEMHQGWIETCRQTMQSPAEHDEVLVCSECFEGDGPEDEAFVRADLKYRERTGSHL